MLWSKYTPPGKSYTGEGSAILEKLEKPVWRPEGGQLNQIQKYSIYYNENKLLVITKLSKLSSLWSPKLFSNYLILPLV